MTSTEGKERTVTELRGYHRKLDRVTAERNALRQDNARHAGRLDAHVRRIRQLQDKVEDLKKMVDEDYEKESKLISDLTQERLEHSLTVARLTNQIKCLTGDAAGVITAGDVVMHGFTGAFEYREVITAEDLAAITAAHNGHTHPSAGGPATDPRLPVATFDDGPDVVTSAPVKQRLNEDGTPLSGVAKLPDYTRTVALTIYCQGEEF